MRRAFEPPFNWMDKPAQDCNLSSCNDASADPGAYEMELSLEFRRRVAQLTPKEQACLRLVSQRLSSKEIGAHMGISKTSVDTYCNRARVKLGVADRFEAARALQAIEDTRGVRGEEAVPAPPASPPARRALAPIRALAMIAALAAAGIGLASLLAGLRALETMRPNSFAGHSVRALH